MPRPLRIEYENAYYHVMNRGRARQKIFHGKAYFELFLLTLAEAHERFGLEVLCYCFMGNHYHLLVKTPEANLGRIMRHINGVYTQRYNRLKKTDGALFRGRYKAICVEEDSYQLQLSRYIHRNPLEARMVQNLKEYEWSSYQYYIDRKLTAPKWLFRSDIYNQLGAKRKIGERYRLFVEQGVDEEIQAFYGKGNVMPYLGSDEFRAWAYSQRSTDEQGITKKERSLFRPRLVDIIDAVSMVFSIPTESILHSQRGTENVPRWVAMYLCQQIAGASLADIAKEFGLKRTGSILLLLRMRI